MNKVEKLSSDTKDVMAELGHQAKQAASVLAIASREDKDAALIAAADAMSHSTASIVEANALDLAAAREAGRPDAFVDRLALDEKRVECGKHKGRNRKAQR